ncbi:hypothetical protein BZA05DRAFT_468716 [Tricharina praecox]|uniref:uncharacterized protein n=1 Tax=Tricharina praecox TaxID=43433 RepID=UPI00221F6FA0|nr:uncharacterized protein BZA05DRAFT_468716 [Tricharina praecox]KAI5854028.1 hypothetical protein BZA05DRAFT_468716 [Tricharina praecox]
MRPSLLTIFSTAVLTLAAASPAPSGGKGIFSPTVFSPTKAGALLASLRTADSGSDDDDNDDDASKGRLNLSHQPDKYPHGMYDCETSWASPTLSEIKGAVKKIRQFWTCEQSNPGGSKCELLSTFNGGSIAICGKLGRAISCWDVARAIEQLMKFCKDEEMGRAGGTWYFDDRLKTILY